jgi:hypothetical protein
VRSNGFGALQEDEVEEEKIKSALEIAMEKVARLPGLTPEEIAAQKEKEYGPIGEALCLKYLKGTLSGRDLPSELDKYRGDEGRIVRRALILSLCRSIQFEDVRKARIAMEGIALLAAGDGNGMEEARRDFEQILGEVDRETQKTLRTFESSAKARLKSLGISGSAIRLNPNADPDWLQELARIRQAFEPRMEKLRVRLSSLGVIAVNV